LSGKDHAVFSGVTLLHSHGTQGLFITQVAKEKIWKRSILPSPHRIKVLGVGDSVSTKNFQEMYEA